MRYCLIAITHVLFISSFVHSQNRPQSTQHALLIALDYYADERWPALNSSNAPARLNNEIKELTEVLISDYYFERENICLLTDQDATRESIYDFFKPTKNNNGKFESRFNKNDTLLIWFAGHGETDLNESYWIPYDGNFIEHSKESMLDFKYERTWIRLTSLMRVLESMPIGCRILIIGNTCYSGIYLRSPKVVREDSKKVEVEMLASSRNTASYTGNLDYLTHFGYHFLKILKENSDSIVSIKSKFEQLSALNADSNLALRSTRERKEVPKIVYGPILLSDKTSVVGETYQYYVPSYYFYKKPKVIW